MGQGASSIVKCLSLCGESSEDHEHEHEQNQTQPLFYSQFSSSRSSTNANNNINYYALLLPTLSSSSSGSNSFVGSTTSHISLPPYTTPVFYNEHTIKCDDALDHQNLLDSNSVSSSTIAVRSLREYSASFGGTANPHGEKEFVCFPRFGDEYSSVTTTESDPPVNQVIDEEEEEEEEKEFVYFPRFGDKYSSVTTTESDPPADQIGNLIHRDDQVIEEEEEFVYLPRFGDEYSSVTTTESDPPVDQVIEEEEEEEEKKFVYFPRFGDKYLSVTTTESDPPVNQVIEEEEEEKEFVYFPRFGDKYSSVTTTESDPPVDQIRNLIHRVDQVIEEEEEFVYFPRFGDEYSSVTTTESDPTVDQIIEEERVSKKGVAIKEIRRINHYSSNQRILLVGEGDFSFSRSLAQAFGYASNIIATSLDSIEFLQKNYEKAMSNIQSLKARGCIVLHGVDATQMVNSVLIKGMKFDRIIYNFPLAGFFPRESRKAQLRRNRALVGGFLENAKKMISENGEIHITHKSYGFFLAWQLEAMALARGLRLVQELHFNLKDYPGYCTKYGFGGDKNFDCCRSKTYKFGLLY